MPSHLIIILILWFFLLWPRATYADELAVLTITLNQQKKGDFFVILKEDGDFLVAASDLAGMGLQQLPQKQINIDGVPHVSLLSMEEVEFRFDETTLALNLNVAPKLLPKSIVDLTPPRRQGVIYPRDSSIFLNYGIDYSAGGENLEFEGVTVSNEIGGRFHDLLLLTDSIYTESVEDSRFVRLNTNLTWDDRLTFRRIVGGDFFAFSGELGSRVQLGGLSISKRYNIDPYFIHYPLFNFNGMATLPSDVELYVDGVKTRSDRFAPGEFELRNFQSISGAHTLEIVIRDALGREKRVISPFYFTDQILRQGLNEYSYNLGILRRDFGQESNRYSDLAFSAFHRYGLTDSFNVGFRAEAGDGIVNIGIESAMKTGSVGLLRIEGANSLDRADSGFAGFLSYEYSNRRFHGHFAFQGFSEGYRTLGDTGDTFRRKLNLIMGLGYLTPRFGSVGLDYAKTESYPAQDSERLTLSWSRRLWEKTYVNANISHIRENETRLEAGINLTWYLGRERSVSGAMRYENDANIQILEIRRNTPTGEGTGWNLRGERSATEGTQAYLLNSVAQHNARHAILRGDFSLGQSETLTTEDLRLSVAGALVYVDDTLALTRPVSDSFALVSVGEVEGVGVYINGQASGRTNRRGKIIIPELSSFYENQVSIEGNDIPLDFLMPGVRLDVSPPFRSGSCLNFPLQKFQSFTGTLVLVNQDEQLPLANAEVNLAAPGGSVIFWTGGAGEFYFDSQLAEFDIVNHQGCGVLGDKVDEFLPPGHYPIVIKQEGTIINSEINIPVVSDQFFDLGEVSLSALNFPTLRGEPKPLE